LLSVNPTVALYSANFYSAMCVDWFIEGFLNLSDCYYVAKKHKRTITEWRFSGVEDG